MTKNDLLKHMMAETGINLAQCAQLTDALLGGVTKCLVAQDSITFPGFGTFSVSYSAERKGRNPRTGEALTIAAKHMVKFKVSSRLKEEVA